MTLEVFLEQLDLNDVGKSIIFSDLEDDDSGDQMELSSRNISPMILPSASPQSI